MPTKKDSAARQKKTSPRCRIYNHTRHNDLSPYNQYNMASVYKSISKANGGEKAEGPTGVRKNKQRVLILSSRGVTHR